jgi:serine/threonine protein kinase
VVRALDFLNYHKITHRDLKPDNVFIKKMMTDKEGNNMVTFKLGDFGFAVKSDKNKQIAGTYPYMSPEMYKLEEYGNEVDVWALGVITNELLFGENPFIGKNKAEIQNLVLFKPYFVKVPGSIGP